MLTTTAQRREWLGLLEAELARRTTQAEWEAGEDERLRQQLLDELEEMARRLAAGALLHPLQIVDMSCAEMLACRFFCRSACGRRGWEPRMRSSPWRLREAG
jgi:hypothetical protein